MSLEMDESRRRLILVTGIVGAGGALLMAVCDLLLFAYPTSGPLFLQMEMGRGTMALLPQWRLTVGSIVGALVAPLQIVGFWQVFIGVRPAGGSRAWAAFLLLAYAITAAGAVHGTFVFVGTLLKVYQAAPEAEQGVLRVTLDHYYAYQTWLYVAAGAALLLGSVVQTVSVWGGASRYPRWSWWVNPFLFVSVVTLLGAAAPAPIGGYMFPVQFNGATLLFFLVSTWLLLMHGRSADTPGDGRK
jgi:hypothetical protein